MKVAIPLLRESLTDPIEPRLGRAPVFALVDLDTDEVQWLHSEQETSAHGSGTQTAQRLASNGAEIVLCRQIGPNALEGLSAAGIGVYQAPTGSAADAIGLFRKGLLTEVRSPSGEIEAKRMNDGDSLQHETMPPMGGSLEGN